MVIACYNNLISYQHLTRETISGSSSHARMIKEMSLLSVKKYFNKDHNKLSDLIKVGEVFIKGIKYFERYDPPKAWEDLALSMNHDVSTDIFWESSPFQFGRSLPMSLAPLEQLFRDKAQLEDIS